MEEPPAKKAKAADPVSENIDNLIENIKNSPNNLHAILNLEIHDSIPTEKVYVGHIKNSKDLSITILTLNEIIPLKQLQHLKRVRKKDVLLCPTSYLTNNSSIQEFLEANVPSLRHVFEYFKEIEVPALPPKLKRQHFEFNKVWSCNFHPNEYLEKMAVDNFFNEAELKNHRMYMAIAFDVAKFYLEKTNNVNLISSLNLTNVTVIVDPSISSIVDIAFDNRENHPLQHSTMLAIDNVAKTQNGGAWNVDNKNGIDNKLWGIDKELLDDLQQKHDVCIGARQVRGKNESCDDGGPYLCTGYYVYTIREPCIMCSMALVHARAKRVFFCFENTSFGALKCKTQLQNVPFLNHRFEVFTGFL
ncbi:probable inactive tRNA-specific adenosine deaminase-like protein 3 [Galleria mellonella]|uniref:Probable inactive tRNA-specific adenosine deaminase-like protein 3 n=1 Tax=Galleria mellonella TaxID=7137 RepID=A0A6J1WHF7_GALME|nr:probable inactive tRNA-specific adenosine deaminase-like protein 3 [Galleria mellonella]